MMNAAEHVGEQRIAGVLPVQIVGVCSLDQESEQASGQSNHAARNHEGAEFEAVDVVAEASCPGLVFAKRLERSAKRRMAEPPDTPDDADRDAKAQQMKG